VVQFFDFLFEQLHLTRERFHIFARGLVGFQGKRPRKRPQGHDKKDED
jgi:hypothetical protein